MFVFAAVLVFSLVVAAGSSRAMGYARADTGPCAPTGCIVATGTIGAGSAEDFAALLKIWKPAPGTVVLLDSDGGDVVAALKLGGVIRRAGLSTLVAAYSPGEAAFRPASCASACAYAFLGGARRALAPGSRFGVHQVYGPGGGLSAEDAQWLNALIAVHLNKMGASLNLLTLAMSTPPTRMRWLTAAEMGALGVRAEGGVSDGAGSGEAAAIARLEREIGGARQGRGDGLALGR